MAYSEDFGGLLGEDSVKSSIGKRQSSSRSGLGATMAYTEDFEEAESAAAGSVSELPLSSAAVPQSKSMASASYSEDFDAPREERSERAQSGLGASMAYTEDFDEAEDQDDGDEMAGGGIFGNVMDASDIGAMLMEDDPLEVRCCWDTLCSARSGGRPADEIAPDLSMVRKSRRHCSRMSATPFRCLLGTWQTQISLWSWKGTVAMKAFPRMTRMSATK